MRFWVAADLLLISTLDPKFRVIGFRVTVSGLGFRGYILKRLDICILVGPADRLIRRRSLNHK